ncbi:hypothetical [Prochlorococcus marinus str. MIT 9313]|uniref:Uncharacterized protein n=1 Tax=Prochlorococcus marinus (strain MIT 9313) TaxID=74547 RepID=Q7V5J2_PROMM|nr:hypothetical [Prochlorococcus marinus str. MIT 9313]
MPIGSTSRLCSNRGLAVKKPKLLLGINLDQEKALICLSSDQIMGKTGRTLPHWHKKPPCDDRRKTKILCWSLYPSLDRSRRDGDRISIRANNQLLGISSQARANPYKNLRKMHRRSEIQGDLDWSPIPAN